MKQLAKEHGCKTVEEAERLLTQKRKEKAKVENKLDRLLTKLEEEFPDVLE